MKINGNKRLQKVGLLLIFLAISVPLISVRASADDTDTSAEAGTQIEDVIGEFEQILPEGREELATVGGVSDSLGFEFLIGDVMEAVRDGSGEFMSFFILLVGVSLMVSLSGMIDGELGGACRVGVGIAVYSLLLNRLLPLVDEISASLSELNGFFSAVIPVAVSVNVIGLSTATASVQSIGMGICLGFFSAMSGGILTSAVGLGAVLSALEVMDGTHIGRIGGFVRRAFFVIIGALTALMSAVLALQSVIASHTDTAAVRTVRYAASSMIPIVGGTVSTALSTLAGGISYARGIVGGGAIAAIVSIALVPFVTLLMYKLCFSVAIMLTGMCSDGADRILRPLASSLDALIAIYALCASVYILQLVAFLKGGAAFA